MRYFIFYPPSDSIRLIDVGESVRVEDVLELVQKEFGLKIHGSGRAETSLVLSYNGFDLKPKWLLADLNIPSGAIIRCLYREQKSAHLYIHCGFNKQTLNLFDSSITIETTIGTIRKKISDQLGLPLSIFCLETFDGKQRLYDEMNLTEYEIKMHDHIYLKVWRGYEKFINSCIRGFSEHYSHDDLTRHYQTQVALHIAAFYGHMELATSAMQQGARSDRPVDDHPSRQWSSETATQILPEMLKCPIHIAIERGHAKIVDLFVRQSILCTQVRHPITGYLPYRLALSCSMAHPNKEEKQRYNQMYFYLYGKQDNLRIPLNATADHVSSLLRQTTYYAVHRTPPNCVFVSLALYCKIINWCERARENAWKRFGGRDGTTSQIKRVYPQKGLLGYKVLIDGYNNKFEVPKEQLQGTRSGGTTRADNMDRYIGFSDEEREKIIQMKSLMKQFTSDERRRAKKIAATQLKQSRRTPLSRSQTVTTTTTNQHKNSAVATQPIEGTPSSSDFSNSQNQSTISPRDLKACKPTSDVDNSLVNNLFPSTFLTTTPTIVKQAEDHHESTKRTSKNLRKSLTDIPPPRITVANEDDQPIIPSPLSILSVTHSTLPKKLDNKQTSHPLMSSVDAYLVSSTRLATEIEQHKVDKQRELITQFEQTFQQPQQSDESTMQLTNQFTASLPADRRSAFLDLDSYIPLPDHPTYPLSGPIKSRIDLEIHQTTVKPYERYSSATTRSTAIDCLQEASYFKRKSWLKQVEISKAMVKHKVQRRIRRADNEITNRKPTLLPIRSNSTKTLHETNTIKVN